MTINPLYEPRTMLEPFLTGPLVHTFLRDTFFQAREFPPTSLVEFDFRRGRRRMAPFVAPLVGGKVMERQGYETRFYRAPRIAPARALRLPDLEARLPGENIYSGRTKADRAMELLAEDSIYLDEAISRREEWMCRNVLVNGGINVTAENGYVYNINYLESSTPGTVSNHEPVTTTWDQAASDPLADLERARLNTIKLSGISPNVALFGYNAKETFIRNAKILQLLNTWRWQLGTIAPIIENEAVIRFGLVPGLELYQYSEYFEDDNANLFPMLPDNFVMLLSTTTPNKIVYGAFTQLENALTKTFMTYQTARIPLVYGDEEDGNLWYRLTALPLPMPADILGMRVIEALPMSYPAGTGPGEKEPYFEADQPAKDGEKTEAGAPVPEGGKYDPPQETNDLEAHTVDELREIADKEGVDISAHERKADIIKAIKKARKG